MTTFHTIATFARVLRSWAEAIQASDIGKARFYAEQVKAISTLIAVDPSYRSLFEEFADECDSGDPEQAAKCIHAFISATTEAAITNRHRGRE